MLTSGNVKKIKVVGKIASQPVVLTTEKEFTVFVLIQTDKGNKEFFYSYPNVSSNNVGIGLTDTTFTHIALSAVGDDVEINIVIKNEMRLGNKITNFLNVTRNLGKVYF